MLVLSLVHVGSYAQELDSASFIQNKTLPPDSLKFAKLLHYDSIKITKSEINEGKYYDPGRAALLSAVVPGLGQIYNDNAWKVPIIYAGGMIWAYLIKFNHQTYQQLNQSILAATDDNPETIPTIRLSVENMQSQADSYRRNRDLNIIIAGIWYLLNIAEAHVDAHLKEFDISKNLAIKLAPTFGSPNEQFAAIGLQYQF